MKINPLLVRVLDPSPGWGGGHGTEQWVPGMSRVESNTRPF